MSVNKLKKNLTIIIVTYNSNEVIEQCLNKLDYNQYNIIIVDNNSSDQTLNFIQNSFPKTKIIKSDKNIGYGRANNIALKEIKTDFALILNPDAFIFENDIDNIFNLMQKKKDIALSAPLLLKNYPPSKQDIEDQLKVVESNLIKKIDNYLSVKYIVGAVLFLRMSVFRKIGFFDENTFLYYEDNEICHRAIEKGYKAIILPSCKAYHMGSKSSGNNLRAIYRRYYHKALSKFYWKKKLKGTLSAYKSAVRFLISHFLGSIFYLLTFNFKKFISNLASACGSWSFLIGLKAFKKNGNSRG